MLLRFGVSIVEVVVLSIVQGFAELLPVSSSAHVVVAEKLMGIDPTSPEMTLLLVMLHTGTMFAVVTYFWTRWRTRFFHGEQSIAKIAGQLVLATALTGAIGEVIVIGIERIWLRGTPHADVEMMFGHLGLISAALAAVAILILWASTHDGSDKQRVLHLSLKHAAIIGVVQGLCLPFRGFSRSGATISTAMLISIDKTVAEDFSFALAVVLTPPIVLRELLRLLKAQSADHQSIVAALSTGVLGGVCAFLAGLVALRWWSRWLESGRWRWFGIYCLVAAAAVATLYDFGF